MKKGFSLVELLIAIGILAVVASMITVKYLDVQKNTIKLAAQTMEIDFNTKLHEWQSAGGTLGTSAYTSDIFDMFASSVPYSFMAGDVARQLVDGGTSQYIRMAIPGGADTTSNVGNSIRAVFTDSSKQFIAVYKNDHLGIVPTTGGLVTIYFWGTADDSRHVLATAVGDNTVAVLQTCGLAWETVDLKDFKVGGNGESAYEEMMNGTVGVSSVKPGDASMIGANPYPSWDRSIAIFKKTLDSSGNPVFSDNYNLGETFFNSSEEAARWSAAKQNVQ